MCGRYANTRTDADLIAALAVEDVVERAAGGWNVTPTQVVDIVRQSRNQSRRELTTARWGLIPTWAKDSAIGARLINARSETVTVKPSFRTAARYRRAVVPADGYYEWQVGPGGRKEAYFLGAADGALLAFAGLYEYWRDPAAPESADRWRTCTIITRAATDAAGQVHDRMPVVLPAASIDRWLDRTMTDPAAVDDLLRAAPPPALAVRRLDQPVGTPLW